MSIRGLNVKNFYEGIVEDYGDLAVQAESLRPGASFMSAYLVSMVGLTSRIHYNTEVDDIVRGHVFTTYPDRPLSNEQRLIIVQRRGQFEQSFDVLQLINKNRLGTGGAVLPLTESGMASLLEGHSLGSYLLAHETGLELSRSAKIISLEEAKQQGLEIIERGQCLGQIDRTFLEKCADGN